MTSPALGLRLIKSAAQNDIVNNRPEYSTIYTTSLSTYMCKLSFLATCAPKYDWIGMVVVIGNLYVLLLDVLVCLIIGTMIDLKSLASLLIFKSCRTYKLDISSYSKSLDSSESETEVEDSGVLHLA